MFGLGDRTYEQYCAMGHFYHDRMTALGGTALLPVRDGHKMDYPPITWP